MKKNKKEKQKMKKWEKFFLIGNLLVIFGFIGFYSYRLIHYYRLENPEVDKTDKRLITFVKKDNNVVLKDDGLYNELENKDNYYFKGKDINSNYVFFSGRMWRIIKFDKDNMTLISDDIQTTLSYGQNDFEKSYVYDWLSKVFLKSIDNYDKYLVKSSYCFDQVDLENITCEKNIESYFGLLSIKDYLDAGGKDSFINNNTYFYTSNFSKEGNVWYIFDEGGLNNKNEQNNYGVRPVIRLKNNIKVYQGNGTKENPYYLDDNNNTIINSKSVGAFIKINNNLFRIIDKNDKGIKIILQNYYRENDKDLMIQYDEVEDTIYTNTSIKNYIDKLTTKLVDKKLLATCSYNIGKYENNYNTVSNKKINSSIGLPSVGDLFINNNDKIWLSNNIDEVKKVAYTTSKNATLYADNINNKNYIVPVLCINSNLSISGGKGLFNDPYIVEVNNEVNN